MSFSDQFKDGPLALGMHKKNSFHDIVTVDNCKIVDRDYNIILRCVLDYCAKKELPFYHKLRHEGYVRHLLVRRTTKTKELLVALVTTSDAEMEKKADLMSLVICQLSCAELFILLMMVWQMLCKAMRQEFFMEMSMFTRSFWD